MVQGASKEYIGINEWQIKWEVAQLPGEKDGVRDVFR